MHTYLQKNLKNSLAPAPSFVPQDFILRIFHLEIHRKSLLYQWSNCQGKTPHTHTHVLYIYIYNNHLGLCLQPTIVCFINLDMQMRSTSTCTHINRELFFPWEFSSSWSKSKTSRIFIQSEIPGWSNYVESKHLWIHGIHWWKVKWMV